MRDTSNPYSSRDWADTIGWFGVTLLLLLLTLCTQLVVLASVYFIATEGSPGYILLGLAALGFSCLFGSSTKWAFDSMRDA